MESKSQSTRFALALAIVEGNLVKVEEIVEAYIALYRGLPKQIHSFMFDSFFGYCFFS